MLHVALLEPEIPPNTGNVARLCAATGCRLHLVGKLGYSLDDKYLRRAGLDYWPAVDLATHPSWEAFLAAVAPARVWCVETPFDLRYTEPDYRDGDCLLFGRESVGLPAEVRAGFAGRVVGIPMPAGRVRSLNLSTAVGIVVYEALRRVHNW